MNKHSLLISALAAALLGIAAPAAADFYEFTFSGEITTVDGIVPEPWDTVHVGSEFELTYVFDSETPDQMPLNWIGVYDVMWAEVTIDGAPQLTEESTIVIMDEGLDRYTVQFRDLPIGADGNVNLVGWDVIESDELLLDIDLDEWTTSKGFGFTGIGPDGVYEVHGSVASFTSEVIPGPGTLACFILGGLAGSLRRRNRVG